MSKTKELPVYFFSANTKNEYDELIMLGKEKYPSLKILDEMIMDTVYYARLGFNRPDNAKLQERIFPKGKSNE